MRVGHAFTAGTRHIAGAWLEALLLALIITMALLAISPMNQQARELAGTGSAFAAKGHASTSGTTISVPDGAFGSSVTGTVTGSVTWIHIVCRVSSGGTGLDTWAKPSSGSFTFQLGPTPTWTSGGAACTASAGTYSRNGRFTIAASTTFNAY